MSNTSLKNWLLHEITTVYDGIKHLTAEHEDIIISTFRTQLEPVVYDKLRKMYMDVLKSNWQSRSGFSSDPKNTIFLYETRCHPNLEFLIYNVYYFTHGWAFLFYCTEQVKSFVKDILGKQADSITFHVMDDPSNDTYITNRSTYNELLRSLSFWESLHKRGISHVMSIETDCYLRKHFMESVDEYDYIASRWAWSQECPGGGGLTVRRVTKALEIFEKCPVLNEELWAQDAWFSSGIMEVGGVVEDSLFAESTINPDATGLHQWWSFISPLDDIRLELFVKYMTLEL
jgi:hypothetical protein